MWTGLSGENYTGRDTVGASDIGSCAFSAEYITEEECVEFHGVFERKKRADDVRQAYKLEM